METNRSNAVGHSTGPLSFEDQLAVYVFLTHNNFIGKTSPAMAAGEGSRAPVKVEALVPTSHILEMLAQCVDTPPITAKVLARIIKEFEGVNVRLDSFPPGMKRKRAKKRKLVPVGNTT